MVDRTHKGCDECPFCGQRETQIHLFQECGWVRRVWSPSSLNHLFERGTNLTCEEWLISLQELEEDEAIRQFLVALWFIWNKRNNQMWNKKKMEEYEIINRAERWLAEYLEYQTSSAMTPTRTPPSRAPQISANYKINCNIPFRLKSYFVR
ncbi:unnamed protein product [Linum trigynum]|uniref:Reverse transcriptase zinc-binding domain-containing protein n=1 Tax=Linum trigynum TaxID=586398 RepID=A0AAV2FJF8_9ROSI